MFRNGRGFKRFQLWFQTQTAVTPQHLLLAVSSEKQLDLLVGHTLTSSNMHCIEVNNKLTVLFLKADIFMMHGFPRTATVYHKGRQVCLVSGTYFKPYDDGPEDNNDQIKKNE